MPSASEFELPSAILTAAVIAKSELTGKQLEQYVTDLQRFYVRQMIAFDKKLESGDSD